jgi:hypothetical protein
MVLQYQAAGVSMGDIAKRICDRAVDDGCTDNVTLIIVDLHAYYLAFHKMSVIDFEHIDFYIKGGAPKNNKVSPAKPHLTPPHLTKDGFDVPSPPYQRSKPSFVRKIKLEQMASSEVVNSCQNDSMGRVDIDNL